ncbi:MAG: peptidase, partial [Gammaproteobacteria bacterium]|nr:peptidase [Gammaproteobacteria bacterium]
PSADGESHTFTVRDIGASQAEDRQITLQATEVTADPVPMVDTFSTASGNVGYMLFFDHNFVSEDKLYDAMSELANDNVNDLILDLRYNGGGYLYIASQLSYMIAGANATDGKTFEEIRFNDKYPDTDPVTGSQLSPVPFYNSISQYSDNYAQGTALPQLNLDRVFILATDSTCSASEAIINGLRGIDVEVILIGDTTCGKPYGFYATDNCGTTYFTIQFDGINDKGIGGYSDGFSPMNTSGTPGELIAGCSVADDLSTPLGDYLLDPLVSAALDYRIDSNCPTVTNSKTQAFSVSKDTAIEKGLKIEIPEKLNQKIYIDPYSQ